MIFCLISATKGHRRQGSYNDILENLDQEVDIYITQLSALLKLMQVLLILTLYSSNTGLLWEDYVVVMVSMCLLRALLLDYYGKTVLWSWCQCV